LLTKKEKKLSEPNKIDEFVQPVATSGYVITKRFGFAGARYEVGDVVPMDWSAETIKKLLSRNLVK